MKKTNKKGFTLVELLAVIVILGVLLMIAVPAIQNVIKKSKKNAFEKAAMLAVENVETMASAEALSGKLNAKCYVPITDINLERGDWGKNPQGYVEVETTGKATIYISNSNYSGSGNTNTFTFDSSTTAKGNKPSDATISKCTWWEK